MFRRLEKWGMFCGNELFNLLIFRRTFLICKIFLSVYDFLFFQRILPMFFLHKQRRGYTHVVNFRSWEILTLAENFYRLVSDEFSGLKTLRVSAAYFFDAN